MLSKAALRAIKPSAIPSRHALRCGVNATAFQTRTYADRPRRPPPPHPSTSSRPAKPPPPQPFLPGSTGPARQTSPGTSVPKDDTWKPKDAIKFGGPAASLPSAAGAKTRVEGSRLEDGATGPVGAFDGDVKATEPVAQKADADEPMSGTIRDTTQSAQAAAENMPSPQESPGASGDVAREAKSQQPLPDLRQGIPSTFDMEFGAGKQQVRARREHAPEVQEKKLDITSIPPEEESRRREREEREYDRSAYETSLDRRRATLANYLYGSILFISLSGALFLGRPFSAREDVPSGLEPANASGWGPSKMYARIKARLGHQLGYYTEPTFPKLLPEVPESQRPPFTLVLSLEDLMVHSTWDRKHGYRTAKRPGIDYFIRYLLPYYELVLFTSVPLAVADPVIKKLDPYHFIQWPLGREATKYDGGEYVKDLSYLNRDLKKTIIIDTHAPHAKNQPENAIILPKWSGDPKDERTKDLVALIPFLEYVATMGIDDVRSVLRSFEGKDIPREFARREAEARKKFNEQLTVERAKKPRLSLGSLASGLGVKNTPGMSMGGGMVLADGSSVAEGLAQGKMLSDQIREQGQKQYEHLEKQIREHGAQWLKEEEEEQKKMMDAQMKDMKKGAMSWFGGGGKKE